MVEKFLPSCVRQKGKVVFVLYLHINGSTCGIPRINFKYATFTHLHNLIANSSTICNIYLPSLSYKHVMKT